MNRNQEYLELLEELEMNVPDLQRSVKKARARRFRHTFVYRPAAVLAVCFVLFTALVNFSPIVAYACSQVPGLRELAAAVTFSASLSDAVENEYVQQVNLTQTKNDITVQIPYLIVDEKQVNVFYSLSSDRYEDLDAYLEPVSVNGSTDYGGFGDCHSSENKGKKLRVMTFEFDDNVAPRELEFRMIVQRLEKYEWVELAQFDFLLEPDLSLIGETEIIPAGRILEMNGQKITVRQIEVYPTNIMVELEEDPENTAWLKGLDFYIQADGFRKFEPTGHGSGAENSRSILSYQADSTYFYRSRHIKLVIRGAEWQEKDMKKTRVDLLKGQAEDLPPGTALESVVKKGSSWKVTFRSNKKDLEGGIDPFDDYYDAAGKEYYFDSTEIWPGEPFEEGNYNHLVTYKLRHYPYDEAWFLPNCFEKWTPEKEIVVKVR